MLTPTSSPSFPPCPVALLALSPEAPRSKALPRRLSAGGGDYAGCRASGFLSGSGGGAKRSTRDAGGRQGCKAHPLAMEADAVGDAAPAPRCCREADWRRAGAGGFGKRKHATDPNQSK